MGKMGTRNLKEVKWVNQHFVMDNDRMPPFFDPQSYPPTWHLIF